MILETTNQLAVPELSTIRSVNKKLYRKIFYIVVTEGSLEFLTNKMKKELTQLITEAIENKDSTLSTDERIYHALNSYFTVAWTEEDIWDLVKSITHSLH